MSTTNAATPAVRLRPLRHEDEQSVREANLAMAGDRFDFALGLAPQTDWSAYVEGKVEEHLGLNLRPNYVPGSFLVAVVNARIVGRVSIRHRLNDWLLAEGGHIGYGVLPAFRRRGLATEMLRQSLVIARAHGVGRVLVTCDDDNLPSAAVIERCGGRRDDGWPLAQPDGAAGDGALKRRYWID